MFVKFLSLVALGASCVVAAATPTVTKSLNPPLSAIDSSYHPISQVAARQLTNAKRLASGLPLKPPTRRRNLVSRAQPSGTVSSQGYLVAKDASGNSIGYIQSAQNSFGEYVVDPNDTNLNDRLIVNIDLANAPSGTANIQTVNGPDANLPFFGGIVSYASTSNDLKSGSTNYVYFGGSLSTLPNSVPTIGSNTNSKVIGSPRAIETAIWTLDANTFKLTPQWINTDGSSPVGYLGLSDGLLILTGDINTFVQNFGPVTWVTLYFVPAGTVPV